MFLRDRVEEGAQFLVATHGPMLMALPGARILEFSDEGIREIAWADVPHVALMRDFLRDPATYLSRP